jgi:ribosomal protein S18 acetylase RimI-like enzyme
VDDPLILWARQGDKTGVRAWRRPGATAVACADLSAWDRIAVHGEPDAVRDLLAEVRSRVGPGFRPVGDEKLIDEVAAGGVIEVAARFAWMDTTHAPALPAEGEWLNGDDGVAGLLTEAHPKSYAWPGATGVRRWAGIRRDGELVAAAAEAWSAPGVGFVAGVATRTDLRGAGLGTALCAFVTAELLREHGRVALLVDYSNGGALRAYEKLGFSLRPLAAAVFTP